MVVYNTNFAPTRFGTRQHCELMLKVVNQGIQRACTNYNELIKTIVGDFQILVSQFHAFIQIK